jgi:hypothetical protein
MKTFLCLNVQTQYFSAHIKCLITFFKITKDIFPYYDLETNEKSPIANFLSIFIENLVHYIREYFEEKFSLPKTRITSPLPLPMTDLNHTEVTKCMKNLYYDPLTGKQIGKVEIQLNQSVGESPIRLILQLIDVLCHCGDSARLSVLKVCNSFILTQQTTHTLALNRFYRHYEKQQD